MPPIKKSSSKPSSQDSSKVSQTGSLSVKESGVSPEFLRPTGMAQNLCTLHAPEVTTRVTPTEEEQQAAWDAIPESSASRDPKFGWGFGKDRWPED